MFEVSFTFSPVAGSVSYTIGGLTFPYTTQADSVSRPSDVRYASSFIGTNIAITFVATATGGNPVRYEWDMGDGTILYGDTVIHTFLIANPELRIRVVGFSDQGKIATANQIINIHPSSRITVAQRIAIH